MPKVSPFVVDLSDEEQRELEQRAENIRHHIVTLFVRRSSCWQLQDCEMTSLHHASIFLDKS